MREVEVIPGEEIILFPFEGRNSKVRLTVYPERQLLCAPAIQEVCHMEFEQYNLALERAKVLLNWHNVKACNSEHAEGRRRRDNPGFNINA